MKDNFELKSSSIKKEQNPKLEFSQDASMNAPSYHEQEINMNKTIVNNAIAMIWVGIIAIITFTFLYVFGITDNIFTVFSGVFIDFFSATILYLVNNSTKTKNEYFKEYVKENSEKRLIALVQNCSDEKFREKEIDKLINNYCKK